MMKIQAMAVLLSALVGGASAAAERLAGWHDFDDGFQLYRTSGSPKSADEYLTGISATLYGGDGTRDTWGSTDGTYGTSIAVETSATDGSMSLKVNNPNLYLTVINNTGSDAVLEQIVFDLASVATSSPQDLTLYYDSGDLAVADDTLIQTMTGANATGLGNVSDYLDVDWSLSGLADQLLASGEQAVFRFTVANSSNNSQALGLDNLAVLGQGTPGDPLLNCMAALKNHITGASTLTAAEINAQADIFEQYADEVGDAETNIVQVLDLVETYETEVGYLFSTGEFSRTDSSTAVKALRLAMFDVYQAILDDVYTAANLAAYRNLLGSCKFESAEYFPGAVAAPADSNAVYSVQINASQPEAWGYEVAFQYEAARRPTGAYLAPGTVATVTVPAALVGKGYEIRVGAHVADLKNRPNNYKRLNRVTLTYPIDSVTTEIASPLGGGIYIEVPYGIEEGLVTVDFQNTVRAPFYSNSAARQTTLSEWQNTERAHPGAWADFETDKFMLTVPTDWIYNFSDPVTLMNNWDLAMDACSDMQGLPRIRPKTVLYCIIDVTLDANVYSPGYPQSNDNWTPTSTAGGNKDHNYLNGPKFANHVHLHEFGHAAYISKFNGEVEAVVNLFYVPVHNRMFNVPLEEAFGRSLNTNSGSSMNRKHAAINWVVNELFRNGNPMTGTQMKYQHRGYAKYVEIAALFGWDALGDFWKSVAVDAENGITYSRNSDPADSRILRMSRAADCDLRPLIHFWGVHPVNAAGLAADIQSEGLKPSAAIYDRLKYYQSVVPMTAAEFKAHDNAVGNLINVNEQDQYNEWRTTWTAALGQEAVDAIQDIIDTYFPAGRPIETLPHFEGFEDGIGGWAQATYDDYEWRRNAGGTATASAGPAAAADGDYYMYAEGHDAGGSYKTASFQCTFDFSTLGTTTLAFDYHMYGTYIDFLAVDIYDGTVWTSNVWIRSGAQHSGSADPWSSASVDLTDYAGNDEVTIRFRTANEQWNAADPAIDNIQVTVEPQTPYQSWAATAFAGAPEGTDTSETGNPDQDQFSNRQEWALVLDPMTADVPPLNPTISDPNFIVTYDRRSDSGLSVWAEWAPSLTSSVWKVHGDGLTEVQIGSSGDVQTMAAIISMDGTNRFIRLRIEE